MADLTITAASVVKGANAVTRTGTAGASITAGQVVYEDTANSNVLKLADGNASSATANPVGIALHAAESGQPVTYVIEDDDFTPGATLSMSAAGGKAVYVLSATAGGICPVADLASGVYPVVVFVAKSASKAVLKFVKGTAALSA